jgi:hypothetical protein
VGGLAAGAEGFAGGNGACGETPEEATAGTGGAAGLAVRGFGAVGFGIVAAGEPPSEGFPAAGNGGTASVLGTLAGGGVGFWGPAEHRAWLRRIRTVRTCTGCQPTKSYWSWLCTRGRRRFSFHLCSNSVQRRCALDVAAHREQKT